MAATGRTASTRAMGGASTHAQHLVPIEPAPAVLEARLADLGRTGSRVTLWPSDPWSERTDLTVRDAAGTTCRVSPAPDQSGSAIPSRRPS